MATPRSADATTYQWAVDANGSWTTPTNWAPNGVPNAVDDVAIFPLGLLTAPRTITIPTATVITLGRLEFLDAQNVTITGAGNGRIVMAGAASIDIVKSGSAIATISAPVEIQRNLNVDVTVGTLIFAAGITESGGSFGLDKLSAGTLRFASSLNNTYTGTTRVVDGVLELQHTGATEGINGPLQVGDGIGSYATAEVWINSPNQIDNASSVTVLVDGLLVVNGFGDNVGAVTVTEGRIRLVGANALLNMASLAMTGGATLDAADVGSRFVLAGNVTATSSADFSPSIEGSGTLRLNGVTRVFTIADGPGAIDLLISTAIVGTAAEGLTKSGPGVLQLLSGANNFTGDATVTDGRLELASSSGGSTIIGSLVVGDGSGGAASAEVRLIVANNISDTSNVTVNADGLFNLNDVNERVFNVTVTDGIVTTGSGSNGQLTLETLTMTGGSVLTGTTTTRVVLRDNVVATSSAAGQALIAGNGALNLNGFTRNFNVSNGPAAVDLRIETQIIGTAMEGINKTGDGVLLLTANNTFVGDVNISNGTVLINGTQAQTDVQVSGAGATLGGTGTVDGVSVGAGAIAPGNSPGILNTGTVVIGAGFPLKIELNGTTAGSGYDQLNVAGDVFIGSAALEVTLGFDPPSGAQFIILKNDGIDPISSTFAGLPEGATLSAGGKSFQITYQGGDGNDVVLTAAGAATLSYFLAEGATGSFFDDDVLIANANTSDVPVTLTFLLEGGATVVDHRTVPAQQRITVHVDSIPGLEATSASVQVTADNGLPLIVERSMFWDATYYGGHTANAVSEPLDSWVFAEGSQGFFDTYILVANANAAPTTVTMTFLREADTPVVRNFMMNGFSRLTVYAGDVPELVGRSFGIVVDATLPVIAERSMYFASIPGKFWAGGHNNMGIPAPSTSWFHAEGATGGFFNTFILLSNPQSTQANVTLRFLLDTGAVITENKTIGPNQRLTINPAAEQIPELQNAALSTVVESNVPIVSERSMYWPGDASPFGEGHNSAGVVSTGLKWGLAEGRVGGPREFLTYILLANPGTSAANVTVTYLREGAAPVVKNYIVPATSRFNIDVRSVVPEIPDNSSFGAKIEVTNGVPIAVERSLYWNANGVFWAGGTNALATVIP